MAERGADTITRARGTARNLAFRLERKVAARVADVELRQLRSLERAYGRPDRPEVLMFGDSAMMWTSPTDDDRRHLAEMIRDDLGDGTGVEALVGPGYNPRIIDPFVTALTRCRYRPSVVVVPTSVLMATSTWLAHPIFGWETVGKALAEAVESRRRPRRLPRPADSEEESFDRLPAPSLIGARRTNGELRLLTNAKPTTRWQQVIRLRALMDHYNGERLEPDSPGVRLVGDLARRLRHLELPSIAYIAPINHEVAGKALGAAAKDHIARNARVLAEEYQAGAGELGTAINASFDSPAADFIDPLHLNAGGRSKLATQIADAARLFVANPIRARS